MGTGSHCGSHPRTRNAGSSVGHSDSGRLRIIARYTHPIPIRAPSAPRRSAAASSIFRRPLLSIGRAVGTSGDYGWHRKARRRLSERSGDSSCERWCRLPTAPSTRWNNAENFRGASPSRPAASSGTWRRSKRGWLHADRPQLSVRSLPMSGNGDRARFESRVGFKQRHRKRDEHRDALLASNPGVDDVRPLLHHMAALHLVLSLVVDSA